MILRDQLSFGLAFLVFSLAVGCEPDTAPLVPAQVAVTTARTQPDTATRQHGEPENDQPPRGDEKETRPAPPQATVSTQSGPRECTFDDLKFEMQKGDPFLRRFLTPAIEAIHGQRIRIRGYILPSFQQQGLTQFVLVRDNMECCFGPGAALFDCIVVDMLPGKSTDYTVRPVAVAGTFSIRVLVGPDGRHLAIYHIAGEALD